MFLMSVLTAVCCWSFREEYEAVREKRATCYERCLMVNTFVFSQHITQRHTSDSFYIPSMLETGAWGDCWEIFILLVQFLCLSIFVELWWHFHQCLSFDVCCRIQRMRITITTKKRGIAWMKKTLLTPMFNCCCIPVVPAQKLYTLPTNAGFLSF